MTPGAGCHLKDLLKNAGSRCQFESGQGHWVKGGSMDKINVNGKDYIAVEPNDDKYVIVRTYSAGVFAGYLKKREGNEVTLSNARRIWYWEGAASLSQLAMEGTSRPEKCKFPCPVDEVLLLNAIEILDTTPLAKASIEGVPIWEM